MKNTTNFGLLSLLSILLGSQICVQADGANILFYVAFGSQSHRIAVDPLALALAKNNHSVSFIVQDKPKNADPRFQYFVADKVSEFFKNRNKGFSLYDLRASGKLAYQSLFIQSFALRVCETLQTDEKYLEFQRSNKFDLVIIDSLFNECGYAIAYAHGAKTVVFSISTILPWIMESMGVPDETSAIPDPMMLFPQERNFLQRVLSTVAPVYWKLYRKYYYLPALAEIAKKGLKDESVPDFAELERNTSLVLVNTHVSQEYARSLPPNIIPVGGISWIEKRKPLPQNIENFIKEGKEGFVYVSFGSFIDFSSFPEHVQQRFINALLKFPNIQFIWKLNKAPENLPKNFLVEKWLPQQDLLLHPKIRAFITHSGIGGVNEAIYSSVPLICFPIMTEQEYNANLVQKKGFGIKMEIVDLSQSAMEDAVREILVNSSYKENMNKITRQFLDRPMKPLETALWYVEYVLRHDDLRFLRPDHINQSWWVKRQLDVWLFLIVFITTFNLSGLYVSYKLVKYCCGGSKRSTSQRSRKEKKT